MKEMKTLTINGTSYTVADPDAAHIDDAAASADTTWSGRKTEDELKKAESAMVDKLCPAFSVGGSVVSCQPVEGHPLGVVSHIEPMQAGSGDPNPDNIRSISGHSAVKLWRGGKSLLDINDTLTFTRMKTIKFHVDLPAGTYTVSHNGYEQSADATDAPCLGFTNHDQKAVNRYHLSEGKSKTITIEGPAASIDIYSNGYSYANSANIECTIYGLQITPADADTEYEPYRGEEFTFDLGQDIYGGTLDWNSGLLTITQKGVVMKDLPWYRQKTYFMGKLSDGLIGATSGSYLCSAFTNAKTWGEIADVHTGALNKIVVGSEYFSGGECIVAVGNTSAQTLEDFKAYLESSGAFLVYTLAEPITVQLTPQEILALAGTNSIYSNTGNTDVSGKADPNAVIQDLYNKLNALSATMTALTGV